MSQALRAEKEMQVLLEQQEHLFNNANYEKNNFRWE